MKKIFLILYIIPVVIFGQVKKIPWGNNCYDYASKIWQKDLGSSEYLCKIKLLAIPSDSILNIFYSEFKFENRNLIIYQKSKLELDLTPIRFRDCFFSNIIILDTSYSLKERFIIGHCLRNICLMSNPNENYCNLSQIKLSAHFFSYQYYDTICHFFIEPFFFSENYQFWKKNKKNIEKEIIQLYKSLLIDIPDIDINQVIHFESFALSKKRQKYLDVEYIRQKLNLRHQDDL